MGYYQGDPVFGILAKVGAKVLPRVLPKAGSAIGKIAGRVGGAIGRKAGIIKKGGAIAAGGAIFEAGGAGARRVAGGGGGGERKRYRRMNVTNVKALRRAIRRSKGFAKLARSVLTFTSPKAPKGKVTFKTGRKR